MYNSSQNIREKKIFSKIQMHIMICDNKDNQKPKKGEQSMDLVMQVSPYQFLSSRQSISYNHSVSSQIYLNL